MADRHDRPPAETFTENLAQDLRFGFRQLVRNPLFAAVGILTLALGIGANTAIFSVVDGILFRPLPFPESGELVNVWADVTERGGPADEWLSYANYLDVKSQSESLEAVAAWGGLRPTRTGDGLEAEQLVGAVVAPDMFGAVLRIPPALGRDFRPEDDDPSAAPVAILSHGYWRSAFGADPAVLGTTITLNGQPTEIIGVMPDRFRPPFVPDAQLWMTPRVDPEIIEPRRGDYSWRVVGRLADDATVASADAELRLLGERLESLYPEANTDKTLRVAAVREDLVAPAKSGLLVLLAAVGLVLLIACVNVANLLLARSTARRSELAVRSALGAGRARIAAQLLAEAGLLALAGGAAGVVLALWGTDLLVALAPPGTPRLEEVGVDGRVLAVTALVTLGAGALFGLVPAIRAARADLYGGIREGGRSRTEARGRTRGALVVGQVALALVLLVGAGLLVRSFANLRTHDLGFDPAGVVTLQVNLPGERYDTGDELRAFATELETGLAALPGVERAALTTTVPLTGFDGDVGFNVEGRPEPAPGQETAAWIRQVTPSYFETLRIPILAGRGFTPADDADAASVIVINETFAARHFPDENPLGRRIDFGSRAEENWREIVGVAKDVKNFGVRDDSRVAVYLPYQQAAAPFVFPVLRVAGASASGAAAGNLAAEPERLVPAVRRVLADIDPNLAAGRVATLDQLVDDAIAADRFVATLLAGFAAVALVLAIVGLYGVVAYGVGRRLPEMGVRIALGAAAADIVRMVVGQSMALVGAGIALGLAAAALLSRFVEGLLFGVPALDLATYAAVTAALALAGVLAAAVPAVKAGRVDPVRVLSE